ncbi:TPA: group II intron reverse transcriptase/maturase [Legionella pneumophila]|nr:group II intron reverse transcriptase/maturase [Legionella pneumophila]
MSTVKSFEITKQLVFEAYKRVKANGGTAGVDGQTIAMFEENLKDNLYKLWNRMSSGSYFPPAVRYVEIPKSDGKVRLLGIPTVSDRIAQMVVKMCLEPEIEPHFHPDSYGYRPGKSAHDALGMARQRCWRYNWCVDLDIKGFFDNLDHELVMRAVRKHTNCKWVLLYVGRWLKAPGQQKDGTLIERNKGTPQGGVISPLLANLFLHYAFDKWMQRNHPSNPFERYADDVLAHCKTEAEAVALKEAIRQRLQSCKLELHPEKTRIVYCKDEDRRGTYVNEKFDFLGYTFRARRSKNRYGKFFINFSPAVSDKAAKTMRQTMRSWRLQLRSDKNIEDLGRMFYSTINGWINYYGKFYKSELYPVFTHLNRLLVRWVMRKYKRLKGHQRKATYWIGKVAKREPHLFPHWRRLRLLPAAGQ